MQPNPSAETSMLLFPSLRFFIGSPSVLNSLPHVCIIMIFKRYFTSRSKSECSLSMQNTKQQPVQQENLLLFEDMTSYLIHENRANFKGTPVSS